LIYRSCGLSKSNYCDAAFEYASAKNGYVTSFWLDLSNGVLTWAITLVTAVIEFDHIECRNAIRCSLMNEAKIH
jgi:hypothetical protein